MHVIPVVEKNPRHFPAVLRRGKGHHSRNPPRGSFPHFSVFCLWRSRTKALSMSNSSAAIRVFRGCRVLLARARSSASAAKPSKASTTETKVSTAKEKPKARTKSSASSSPRSTPSRPSGIQKVTPVSPALAEFLKSPEASRSDAVKQIWSYIKLHDLQVLSLDQSARCLS